MSRRLENYRAKREQLAEIEREEAEEREEEINAKLAALKLEEEKRAAKAAKSKTARKIKLEEHIPSRLLPSESKATLPPSEILDLFDIWLDNFADEPEYLMELIQDVKTDLYNRQYLEAWQDEGKREAYAIRWSSSRALAYGCFFGEQPEIKDTIYSLDLEEKNVLCIGGGAGGEVIGLGAVFAKFLENLGISDRTTQKLNINSVDIANWSNIIDDVSGYITEKWITPNNVNKVVNEFNVEFTNKDVLTMTQDELRLNEMNIITSMFTTNELFSENKTGTIKFLKSLSACSSGCLFLIVESAGSYSFIEVGTKKFPVFFLIDTVLCGKPDDDSGDWEIVDQCDSMWYRVGKGDDFQYDMKLENMRFFYRLYRRK